MPQGKQPIFRMNTVGRPGIPGGNEEEHMTDEQRRTEELQRLYSENNLIQERILRIREGLERNLQPAVASVSAMLDLLQDSGLNASQTEYVVAAKRSAETIRSSISTIIDETNIYQNQILGEMHTFDLHLLLDDIVQLCRTSIIRSDEVACDVDIDASLPSALQGYPGLLRRILGAAAQRLIMGLRRGQVQFQATLLGATAEAVRVGLTVVAHGELRGMELESPFPDLHLAQQAREAGVQGRIELGDGRLEVAWEVEMHLPASGRLDLPRPVPVEGKRILVVDGDPAWRDVLREYAYLWGASLQETVSGAEAVRMLSLAQEEGQPFSLLLVDEPEDMDLAELVRVVRRQEALGSLRLVRLSSAARPGDARRMYAMGFDAYFVKPMTRETLREALELVLGFVAPGQTPVLITRHTVAEARRWRREVLIIAQEPTARHLVLLLGQAGFSWDVVASLEAAREWLQRERPGLVFWEEGLGDAGDVAQLVQGAGNIPWVAVRWSSKQQTLPCSASLSLPVDVTEFARVLDTLAPLAGMDRSERGQDAEVDVEALLQQLDGDQRALVEILGDFVVEADQRVAEFAALVSQNDFGAAKEKAWALRGMAGNVRASSLALRAEMAEQAALRGDGRKCLALVHDLRLAIQRVRNVVNVLAMDGAPTRTRTWANRD
jgi:CheY-like chemotaxis protein/HPt (histidine-containing phosphotransfer) domain-containing protein